MQNKWEGKWENFKPKLWKLNRKLIIRKNNNNHINKNINNNINKNRMMKSLSMKIILFRIKTIIIIKLWKRISEIISNKDQSRLSLTNHSMGNSGSQWMICWVLFKKWISEWNFKGKLITHYYILYLLHLHGVWQDIH